jgi:hypothetical protein
LVYLLSRLSLLLRYKPGWESFIFAHIEELIAPDKQDEVLSTCMDGQVMSRINDQDTTIWEFKSPLAIP